MVKILIYLKSDFGSGLSYLDCSYNYITVFSYVDCVGCPIDKRFTIGYCVFVGGNLILCKSKKQHVLDYVQNQIIEN